MLNKIKDAITHRFHRVLLLMLLMPTFAHASSSTGMPWEDPLSKIVDSVTGPMAFGVSVLGVVVAGFALVFGGQLDGFVQKIAILALVIAVIVMATNVMSALFGISSTVVAIGALETLTIA
jgi:type IV secretion system protein VirB2